MGFHIEPITFTVRGDNEFEKYGDNYSFVLTIQRIDQVAMITAAVGEMPRKDRKRFREELMSLGFMLVIWKRSRGKDVLWDLTSNKMEVL